MPGYVYAQRDDDVFVANFIASETTLRVSDVPVTIRQTTDYPWEGKVRFAVEPLEPVAMTLRVRIPGWARNSPVPSDLYRYEDSLGASPALSVNGERLPTELSNGFAVIERSWNRGDVVELELPLTVRRVRSHASVAANTGRVALERGPLVYCVEGVDNGGRALELVLPDDGELRAEPSEMLGGIVTLRGPAGGVAGVRELTAIPYFAWSHRGPNEMAVWLRATSKDP